MEKRYIIIDEKKFKKILKNTFKNNIAIYLKRC